MKSSSTDSDYGKLKGELAYVIQYAGEALFKLECNQPSEAEYALHRVETSGRHVMEIFRYIQRKEQREQSPNAAVGS